MDVFSFPFPWSLVGFCEHSWEGGQNAKFFKLLNANVKWPLPLPFRAIYACESKVEPSPLLCFHNLKWLWREGVGLLYIGIQEPEKLHILPSFEECHHIWYYLRPMVHQAPTCLHWLAAGPHTFRMGSFSGLPGDARDGIKDLLPITIEQLSHPSVTLT